jgi:hypothetical protein
LKNIASPASTRESTGHGSAIEAGAQPKMQRVRNRAARFFYCEKFSLCFTMLPPYQVVEKRGEESGMCGASERRSEA